MFPGFSLQTKCHERCATRAVDRSPVGATAACNGRRYRRRRLRLGPAVVPVAHRVLVTWNAASLTYLGLYSLTILHADADLTRRRAGTYDQSAYKSHSRTLSAPLSAVAIARYVRLKPRKRKKATKNATPRPGSERSAGRRAGQPMSADLAPTIALGSSRTRTGSPGDSSVRKGRETSSLSRQREEPDLERAGATQRTWLGARQSTLSSPPALPRPERSNGARATGVVFVSTVPRC
jgi:hypothetical protein